eukprot:COSAG06_NODE_16226_length_1012_cov_1.985761_1_plen_155_part_10
MLSAGQRHLEAGGSTNRMSGPVGDGVEPFHSLVHSARMARNAERLLDRKGLDESGATVPLQYRFDDVVVKHPGETGTSYHQDSNEDSGYDRNLKMKNWSLDKSGGYTVFQNIYRTIVQQNADGDERESDEFSEAWRLACLASPKCWASLLASASR